jgi:hypothetical protein
VFPILKRHQEFRIDFPFFFFIFLCSFDLNKNKTKQNSGMPSQKNRKKLEKGELCVGVKKGNPPSKKEKEMNKRGIKQ